MDSRRRAPKQPRPKHPAADTPTQVLGRAVRAQRRRLRLTQEALALHAGVGPAFLYQLETGKRTLRLDKVLAVLEVLGLTLTLGLARPGFPPGRVFTDWKEPPQ